MKMSSDEQIKSLKYETFCRLIPSLIFITAVTAVILTLFFTFVLQSGNTYPADGEAFLDDILMDDGDVDADVIHGKLEALDIPKSTHSKFEDSSPLPSTSRPPIHRDNPSFATFLLKKTINPTAKNQIKTKNNLRSLKAYKIISKKPIMENSLVKIVMAPQNILEKLSKPQDNFKYAGGKIDEIPSDSVKYEKEDRASIRLSKGYESFDDVDMSWGKDENVDLKKIVAPNTVHQTSNNIQVIAKRRPKNIKLNNGKEKITEMRVDNTATAPRPEEHTETAFKNEPTSPSSSITTPNNEINLEKVQLDSDTTISNDLTNASTLGNSELSTEATAGSRANRTEEQTNLSNSQNSIEQIERSVTDTPVALTEDSLNDDVPLATFFKTLPEDVTSQQPTSVENIVAQITTTPTTPLSMGSEDNLTNQLSADGFVASEPKKRMITRPSTTEIPPISESNEKKSPTNALSDDSFTKYKKYWKNENDFLQDFTSKVSLFEVDTTNSPLDAEQKSKNIKRAIGDEGTMKNIVRPSPIRQPSFGDFFQNDGNSVERAEKMNKSLQRLMHFVTIAGHLDSYLTKRFRNGLKNIARLFDSEEKLFRRRRSS